MMTTMAALLGGLPLALGSGVGSELRRPLGITIVGGLDLQPGADALYDAGRLSVLRPAGEPSRTPPARARIAIDRRTDRATSTRSSPVNFSAPFIKRPVATSLLTAALALCGRAGVSVSSGVAAAASRFSHDSGQRDLPGASPETMASSVATPLERQFGRIAGVTEMTSSSQLGSTDITLQFDLNRNIDAAARDVQAAINAARGPIAGQSAEQPRLSQSESGRCADHDSGADFGYL